MVTGIAPGKNGKYCGEFSITVGLTALMRIPFSRRQLVIHSPMRIYFITRNRWLLYWLPHVSLGWKLADFPRMLIKLMAFMLFVPPRSRYLKAGFAGLRDGIRRKGGAARASY